MLKPIRDKLLIRPDSVSETTAGGIVKAHKEVADTGTIVAISPEIPADELTVNVGDRVKYSPNHRIEEGEVILLSIENLLWVFN